MSEPLIRCQDVWKTYRQRNVFEFKRFLVTGEVTEPAAGPDDWALKGVSFEVAPGECLGIMGRNGAGKSTLLSVLLGVLRPNSGQVEVSGRRVGLLTLGAGCHAELSGLDNIFVYGSVLGMSLAETKERLPEIVEFAGLGDAIHDPLRTYSTGMSARLGFSVIAHFPADVIVVDEVLGVGDQLFQEKCGRFFKRFLERGGTLVMVSHSMSSFQAMCDRGICLREGEIIAQGPIEETINAYQESLQEAAAG